MMNDLVKARADECADCAIPGYRVDSSDGSVIEAGIRVGSIPWGEVMLLVGSGGQLCCEECANRRANRASEGGAR